MHRLKLLGLALIAVFALSGIASSAALAENPETLPAPTEKIPLKFTSKGGAVNISTPFLVIKCEKLTNKGQLTAVNLGAITLDLINCKCGAVKCWSLGDEKSPLGEKSVILINADFHLVDVLRGGVLKLGLAITFLTELHIEGQGGTLLLTKGSLLGIIPIIISGTKTKSGTVEFKQTKGVQEFRECDLDKAFCEGKKFELLVNAGSGFEPAGVEAEDEIVFETEVAFDF